MNNTINPDQEANNLMLVGLTIEQISKIPKWLLENYEKNKVNFDKAVAGAIIATDKYARADEHHVISQLFSKADLINIAPETLAALKRRQKELAK